MSSRSPWLSVVILCLPMLIVSMDVSVLFFAVPYIAADLNPSPVQQLWIFDVYGFVLAGLLLTMGSVADRIGHRRLLMWGAAGFGAASVLAATASSPAMLIGARAVLAVSGATLMPTTLALIKYVFDGDDARRAKAIATWNAVLAGGVAVGPIISGLLLEHFWWGSVFLINLPVMALLLIVAPFVLPGVTAVAGRHVDLPSAVLALAGVLPTVYALKEFAAKGWSPQRGLMLVVGVMALCAFVVRQQRLRVPMLDLGLLAQRRFAVSVTTNLVCMFALLGNSVIVTQYLQSVLGYSPLRAAMWSVLPTVAVAVAAPVAVSAAARTGRPVVMISGLLVGTGGYVVLAFSGTHTLITALVGSALLASGIVATTSVVADHVVGLAPKERAGATAGLLETTSELGGALGIAVLGSVVSAVYRSAFPSADGSGAAADSLAGAVAQSHSLLPGDAATVLDAARAAYVSGMSAAAWTGAAVLLACAALVAWATWMPRRRLRRVEPLGIVAPIGGRG
ncbi:MFS transporter [Gordonia sp. VNQ95]|jgi:DHA2 family multidrug resistance protein-like MFS transporter|uniref:MFS transporter n=1 Tax=Gordonia TaxID=2053 RepID=UPI0032B32D91